jgi:hypothetical protein
VLRERSLDTCAVYAPDMWPIIGLKSAVMVVGGSKTPDAELAVVEEEEGLELELELEDDDGDGEGCVADSSSGVVSGKVVNRIPVDTAERT